MIPVEEAARAAEGFDRRTIEKCAEIAENFDPIVGEIGVDARPAFPSDVAKAIRRVPTASPGRWEPPTGWKLVPVKDSEDMWGGLARQIVMWNRFADPTGHALYQHLHWSGWDIPDWLREMIPNTNHVPPKGAVCGAIYRAMIEAAPTPPSRERE